MKELFQTLETLLPLRQSLRGEIERLVSVVTAPAHTRLIMAGQLHPAIYYLKEGVLRSFELTGGKEWTNWFFQKGDFAFNVESLLLGQPASGHLESCSEVVLYAISEDDFQTLLNRHDSIRNLSRMLTGTYFKKAKKQVYYSNHLSARDRYLLFVNDHPYIAQRVQSNHLASFLGIFPGSISRFRKRISAEDRRHYKRPIIYEL